SNRQDAQGQVARTELNQQIDNRIASALIPTNKTLGEKPSKDDFQTGMLALGKSISDSTSAIRSDFEKLGKSVREDELQTSKLSGLMDQLQKNVTTLIERGIKGTAALPRQEFVAQVPFLEALYEIAKQRNIPIPNDTNFE